MEGKMGRITTHEIVQKPTFTHPQVAQAACIGPEGLPFVRGSEEHPGYRVILAKDKPAYEAAGWKVQGTVSDYAATQPMFIVRPVEVKGNE
jgi:hypothetical protein